MKESFIYWAQALDNSSPDHIEVHGQTLLPDDTVRRQEAVSLISGVVKAGSRVFDRRGVQLTCDGLRFVMEVPSMERDRSGRTAPIICSGDYDLKISKELSASVVAGLDDFAKRISRNILSEHFNLARESFEVLKKKSSTRRLVRVVVTGIMVLVLLSIAYWLWTMRSANM
ncbi:MAG: hypothetical protein PHP95_14435 [Desulfuromonadaceae bacterium]|nr:hypothetical protein [Desulfuromonadaceae bacterium]MDD2849647.1 hypothetical protein [Desulfuromonadaceae bacterium]MDD4131681.1 hypothetical protein [Desulfuromonadaceae bacterium]